MLYYNVISSDLCNANEKTLDKSSCQGHFKVFSCCNTGTDSQKTSMRTGCLVLDKGILDLMELSSINKFSVV